jgi:hypothetical protein
MNIELYSKINDIGSISALGEAIAKSGMFGCEKTEQGTILALQCITEGKPPLELCKTYHIIGGKLSKRADAMLADFRRAGGKFIWQDIKNAEIQSARVEFEDETYQVSYSTDDAKKAGLLPAKAGSGWFKFPAAMLRARLVSETLRAIAPEIVQGAYTPEEIADFEPVAQPKAQPAKREMKQAEVVTDTRDIGLPFPSVSIREDVEEVLTEHEEAVNAFLIKNNRVGAGQTWRDLPKEYLQQRISTNLEAFLRAAGVSV